MLFAVSGNIASVAEINSSRERKGHAAHRKSKVVLRGSLFEPLEARRLLSGAFPNGNENAIAYDPSSQKLYVAYYDTTANSGLGALKSAYRDSGGDWHDLGTIDNQQNTGHYLSMTIDKTTGAGLPGLAYSGDNDGDLRYSHFDGTSWSSPETADGVGFNAGRYPSLAFNALNRPAISYYDVTHSSLRFVERGGGGAGWGTPRSLSIIPARVLEILADTPVLRLVPTDGRLPMNSPGMEVYTVEKPSTSSRPR